MRACHQQHLLQRQRGRFHVPDSRAAFTIVPVTQQSRQLNRYRAVVQASSATAITTKTVHMPNSKSKSLPFFTNDLDDSPTESASESQLLKPFTNATYKALQVIERGMHSGEGIQGCSIYTGTAGVAYMFLRLAESLQYTQQKLADHPDQVFANLDAACLLNRAEEYGHWAKHLSHCGKHEKRVSFLEGHPGCLAVQTAIASLRGKKVQAKHCLQELESWGSRVLNMPSAECEILYGRCGYLHALLFARKYAGPSPDTQQLIKQLLQQIVEEGQRGTAQLRSMGNTSWDLMWSWHGSYYLGGAHGVCGILLTLMQCHPELEELYPGQATPLLMGVLGGLMTQILPSGNLLSSLGSESDKYVQWCHGAPGLIPVLTKAYQLLDDSSPEHAAGREQILAAARKAADVVWERGLLTKGMGLCHGMSGNAYALLSLYHVTKEDLYKCRAQQFGQFMADHCKELQDVPDAPLSLYEGLGGAVCFWMDVLAPEHAASFPGYEL
ncbi:TPA: hypothetical protein ACH3X2_012560 [Trebouxia sp. C0005]|nr:MAG: lanC 2 [Trebouxia sp. A1-2]